MTVYIETEVDPYDVLDQMSEGDILEYLRENRVENDFLTDEEKDYICELLESKIDMIKDSMARNIHDKLLLGK